MPASARLRRQVSLQNPTRVPDAGGGYTETWTTVATFWAEYGTPTAYNVEKVIGGEVQGVVNFVIRAYYHAAATIGGRIVEGTRIFHILGVRDIDDRHQWMELAVQEQVNG